MVETKSYLTKAPGRVKSKYHKPEAKMSVVKKDTKKEKTIKELLDEQKEIDMNIRKSLEN